MTNFNYSERLLKKIHKHTLAIKEMDAESMTVPQLEKAALKCFSLLNECACGFRHADLNNRPEIRDEVIAALEQVVTKFDALRTRAFDLARKNGQFKDRNVEIMNTLEMCRDMWFNLRIHRNTCPSRVK